MHQFAAWRAGIQPLGETIRKSEQHATPHGIARDRLLADVKTLGCGDAQELLEPQSDLTSCLRIDAHATTTLIVITVALGVLPRAHQNKEVRVCLVAEH